MSFDGGALDQFFIHDTSVGKILEHYTGLTGRMPLPPRWSLGYQQSRASYFTQDEVKFIANAFRAKRIPLDGIAFQRAWEARAFELGGGDYRAPAQLVGDFLQGVASSALGSVLPSYQPGVRMTNLADEQQPSLPAWAIDAIREAGGRGPDSVGEMAIDAVTQPFGDAADLGVLRLPLLHGADGGVQLPGVGNPSLRHMGLATALPARDCCDFAHERVRAHAAVLEIVRHDDDERRQDVLNQSAERLRALGALEHLEIGADADLLLEAPPQDLHRAYEDEREAGDEQQSKAARESPYRDIGKVEPAAWPLSEDFESRRRQGRNEHDEDRQPRDERHEETGRDEPLSTRRAPDRHRAKPDRSTRRN